MRDPNTGAVVPEPPSPLAREIADMLQNHPTTERGKPSAGLEDVCAKLDILIDRIDALNYNVGYLVELLRNR